MKFIACLDYYSLVNLICEAKKRLYMAMPGFSLEVADALLNAQKNGVEVKISIDNSETVVRNGFGDQSALRNIIAAGISVFECAGNMVSFLVADNNGYYIFPQSRIFLDEPTGPNAIQIPAQHIPLLIYNYFPSADVSLNEVIEQAKTASVEDNTLEQFMEYEESGETYIAEPINEDVYKQNTDWNTC